MRRKECFGYMKHSGGCSATNLDSCDGCPFFATIAEAEMSRLKARTLLEKRGLEPYIKYSEDGPVMSTRKIVGV